MEGMMLKLKLQYFGHLMRRVDSLEKTLMLGGIGGRRRRGRQRLLFGPQETPVEEGLPCSGRPQRQRHSGKQEVCQ